MCKYFRKLVMSKSKKLPTEVGGIKVDLGRGKIKDNIFAAMVTSKLYKMQVVKAKKGKGSYQRKAKNVRRESYLIAA